MYIYNLVLLNYMYNVSTTKMIKVTGTTTYICTCNTQSH